MDAFEQHCKEFNDYLNTLPLDQIKAENERAQKANAKDFQEFKAALAKGHCNYCGYPLTHFAVSKPCFHWLLKPKGFKKKHFPLLYACKSFHQIEAYLRWVANSVSLAANINDLVEEKSSSKIIEQTIRYKNLEWSFSCSKGDMAGHEDKFNGRLPHYHFQMKTDGNVVINYGGFHVPFHDVDRFYFAMKQGAFDRLIHGYIQGAGMQELFQNFRPDQLLDHLRAATELDDPEKAPFHLSTTVIAEEGKTISPDEIAALQEESKRTGVPMAKLAHKLKNAKVVTVIMPGPVTPEIAKRSPR